MFIVDPDKYNNYQYFLFFNHSVKYIFKTLFFNHSVKYIFKTYRLIILAIGLIKR